MALLGLALAAQGTVTRQTERNPPVFEVNRAGGISSPARAPVARDRARPSVRSVASDFSTVRETRAPGSSALLQVVSSLKAPTLTAMKTLADYEQKYDHLQDACPVRAALDVIRGRWKPSILYELKGSPKRFCDLREALSGITSQALTVQLRQLEADGVISRTVYSVIPARVEYTLTEPGAMLSEVMDQLETWGAAYLTRRGRRTVPNVALV